MRARPLIVRVVLLAVAYYLLARVGLHIAALPGRISPVWPPTGLSIAALFLFDRRLAYGVFLGAFLTNVGGQPVWVAAGMAAGNTLEAIIGATLLRRFELDPAFARQRDVTALGSTVFATFASAAIGVSTLAIAGVVVRAEYFHSIAVWWLGDVMGALIVTPLLLTWSARERGGQHRSKAEIFGLAAGYCVAMVVAFHGNRPSAFLVYPIVAWAALRYGPRGASLTTFIVAGFAIQRTASGIGRFVTGNPVTDLWILDGFLAVLALTGLVLAAVVGERDRSQAALRATNMELEKHVADRTEALRINNYRLEQAQRVAQVGSWEWDLKTNIVTGSAELDRLYDVDRHPEGADFTTYSMQIAREDRRKLDDCVKRAVTQNEPFVADARIGLRDGSIRWLRIHGAPYGPPGNVITLHGSAQDITETKVAEEAIRASEERTNRIVEAASEAFVSIDIDGRITDWNRQAELTFGWTREEALGRDMVDLIIPGALKHAHAGGVSRYLSTGHTQVLNTRRETTAKHRDGHEFPIELAVWNTEDASGETHFHAFMHDISERLADKAALAEALEEAREASRLKSAFLANMSHEIRTPMNGVMGMVGFLLDTPLDEVQRDYVQTMAQSAEALVAIIDDVLDVSKIEAGKLTIEYGDVDLRKLVQETVTPYQPAASEKGLRLTTSIDSTVPAVVRGDRLRLRQVIGNLVSNAVKFTADGFVSLDIAVSNGSLRFEVADSGIGIAEDARQRLFEPFVQADASTTRRFGGTGLGLSICQQLVQLMGGDIGVTASPAGGSLFWFSVPLIRATDETAPVAEVAGAPGSRRRVKNGQRVLVVEDNAINRKVAVGFLEQLGYEVDIAVDGVDALRIFEPHKYVAVLMDCQMPRMDGYDTTAALRHKEGGDVIPIIAMTASAMASDRERCIAAGMDGFISKPINADTLEAALAVRIRDDAVGETAPEPTPEADLTENDDFDRSVIEHLRSLDDDGTLFHELVTMFRSDFGDQLANLRAAIAAKDANSVRGVAHKMKGSTGLLGLTTLTTELARVEHNYEDLAALTPHINTVQALFKDAIRYLTECDVPVA